MKENDQDVITHGEILQGVRFNPEIQSQQLSNPSAVALRNAEQKSLRWSERKTAERVRTNGTETSRGKRVKKMKRKRFAGK